jgi:hypothetical protein
LGSGLGSIALTVEGFFGRDGFKNTGGFEVALLLTVLPERPTPSFGLLTGRSEEGSEGLVGGCGAGTVGGLGVCLRARFRGTGWGLWGRGMEDDCAGSGRIGGGCRDNGALTKKSGEGVAVVEDEVEEKPGRQDGRGMGSMGNEPGWVDAVSRSMHECMGIGEWNRWEGTAERFGRA